jgi:hypothetical protein
VVERPSTKGTTTARPPQRRSTADVVAALDPDVRAHAFQGCGRRLLVEDDDGIHARQRLQHGGAVLLRHERAIRALQAGDRFVGVQQHDEAVAKGARGLERADVAGVQQVEAATGCDNRAPGRAHGVQPRRRG